MSAHMRPVVERLSAWIVETTHGTEIVPTDLVGHAPNDAELAPFCYGAIREVEGVVTGVFCRLSAPGYMDCTEWSGPFDTEVEARLYLADTYDIDPYSGEEATCD